MERLLNFNEPLDVSLLDRVVTTMYTTTNTQERTAVNAVLTQFQEHPDAWQKVDTILEYSQLPQTKYIALQILESVIRYRWGILPREQCEGIKNYIVTTVIKLSSNEQSLQSNKDILGKLNMVLVQIIKKEWPKHWEQFIPEIVGSSKSNEALCENNMAILRLMSEEVFDFSSGQMTAKKINELKQSFYKEFMLIYQLCEFVLDNSQRRSLLVVTLETLLGFLNWIPLGYIFETKLIETLTFKFLPVKENFRNVALNCLSEIASLQVENLDHHFEKLYGQVMSQLRTFLPPETNIAAAYENGQDEDQSFIRILSLFFTGFFRNHLPILERPQNQQLLLEGHHYLANISLVDEDEIFKICLEYWNKLASDLYHEAPAVYESQQSVLMLGNYGAGVGLSSPRRQLYAKILSRVRQALIRRMPKPEEVLIVEDENGEIVRETMPDSDAITLYKSMRETLIFLTHLDCEDTQTIMLEKLAAQVDGSQWSFYNLNTLCWAIGAISGAQSEEYEKRFLVTVIKDLLGLVEMKRGKDNKAVIASNIMYIVGQYPRFLRAHWRFLKTVVNKLFEFMHESHPGVKDMACETFLTISQKCNRKFVVVQLSETVPYVEEILQMLSTIISDLEPAQIHVFYEAVGCMITAHPEAQVRDVLLAKLMEMPNQTWVEIMAQAARNPQFLAQPEVIRNIANILKTNVKCCTSMGFNFLSQMGRIYLDMLNVYKAYSEMISSAIASSGHGVHTSVVRSMRTIKKESLKLIEIFIEKAENVQLIAQNFMTPLLEAVLRDYKTNIADARDPEVLSVMTAIVNKLQGTITKDVPRIFEHVFECTLEMITKNFTDYPEHRLHFFTLIRAINQHCFQAFFMLSGQQFKLVIDSIVWAFKHTERQISETGLNILIELLKNIQDTGPEVAAGFYKNYFVPLLQDVFFVLTDTFHKSGFKLQATILMTMFEAVESGKVNVALNDADPNVNNSQFVRDYLAALLLGAFPNLSPATVGNFAMGLFSYSKNPDAFKLHLRDFLVQLKEFGSEESNEELFLEERELALQKASEAERARILSVPGLLPPSQRTDDMLG